MKTNEINSRATKIAGCAWTDCEVEGTLAERLRAVADAPAAGGDCDLTDSDRRELRILADEAEAPRYQAVGSVRGNCGHHHRTLSGLARCILADQRDCRAAGGYSDRYPRYSDGEQLSERDNAAYEAAYDQAR